LPQKHEENGVAKAKTRGNIGDTYDIKSNKAAGKKQMLWRLNNLCQLDAALHCRDSEAADEGNAKKDERRAKWCIEMAAKSCTQSGQYRNAKTCQKHHQSVCRHSFFLFDSSV
jgi:hypothetical protein